MKRTSLALAAALSLLLSAGCVSEKNAEIAGLLGKKELKIGMEPNFKPLIFKKDGELKGIEFDLAEKVGAITGAKIVFVECPFNDLIPALEAGKVDVIMSGMTITDERSKKVDFTESYISAGQMALLRTDDIQEFSTAAKIIAATRKIGYVKDTTGDYFVNAKCPNAQKISVGNAAEGMQALSDKKIDVFIIDAPVVWELSSPNLTPLLEPLTEERLGWAVRKGDKRTLEALNKCLKIMKDDGALDAIKGKWVPKILLK